MTPDERRRMEFDTGRVPLFLQQFLASTASLVPAAQDAADAIAAAGVIAPGVTANDIQFEDAWSHLVQLKWIESIKVDISNFVLLVTTGPDGATNKRGFIRQALVGGGHDNNHLLYDHRYFFVEAGTARCVNGLVSGVSAEILREQIAAEESSTSITISLPSVRQTSILR